MKKQDERRGILISIQCNMLDKRAGSGAGIPVGHSQLTLE